MKDIPEEYADDDALHIVKSSDDGVEVTNKITSFSSEDDNNNNTNNNNDTNDNNGNDGLDDFWQRQSKRVARNPCIHLWSCLLMAIGLSYIALVIGEFEVSANTGGWQSRGTLIADRHSQVLLMFYNRDEMFEDGDSVWDDLISTVQPGWEDDDDEVDDDDDSDRRRRLISAPSSEKYSHAKADTWKDYLTPQSDLIYLQERGHPYQQQEEQQQSERTKLPFTMTDGMRRRLEEQLESTSSSPQLIEGHCKLDWYTSDELTDNTRLWPVWKTRSKKTTILSPEVIYDICVSEEKTQKMLYENGLCYSCRESCIPPFSIVLYARLTVADGYGIFMSCEELRDAWGPYQAETEQEWTTCVRDTLDTFDINNFTSPESCPDVFATTMVDNDFESSSILTYTSSIFATDWTHVDGMFELEDEFDRGTNLIETIYDTQYEHFANKYVDISLVRDMTLAAASAGIVALAIVVHTRSLFITLIGLLQIIFSFPLAYFVYKFIIQLQFFPFLNFIGIFVVFALGADDVFVAVDKWKNARLDHPKASTETIAALALPDAGGAMFLTTITTSIAFFATAICPVAPVKMFAAFLGLLVLFDYVMNVLIVFPALCIYDRWNLQRQAKKAAQSGDDQDDNDVEDLQDETTTKNHSQSHHEVIPNDERPSFVRGILRAYYNGLHSIRWGLFVVCVLALIVGTYFASTFSLPTSGDVRLLKESHPYEKLVDWRSHLVYDTLLEEGGSRAQAIWGVIPADTGDHTDPGTFTQLVLDESFDPSSEDAQVHLKEFCEDIFEQPFATETVVDFTCPFTAFDLWLQRQSSAAQPDQIYTDNCGNAASIPMNQADFDPCMIAWSQQVEDKRILPYQNQVKIVYFPFTSRIRYDNQYQILDDEWHLIEQWFNQRNDNAPIGAKGAYFSSDDFWWYDTNGQMLRTAYSSAAIALFASAIVILLSSRSFVLTAFSTLSIAYVLTSVTATLVGLGWSLGFLESICFAVLIGISVDFVIHFSHAYSSMPGNSSRGKRTRHALIQMGPSIFAASFTTVASAVIMLFTVITFFQKFALILFFTIVQATIGSFVFFLTLADTVGPSNPTYLFDKCTKRGNNQESSINETKSKPNVGDDGPDFNSRTMDETVFASSAGWLKD